MSILHEIIPDAPIIPLEMRGRHKEQIQLWHEWYKKHLTIDEHNMEKYNHKIPE